MDPCCLPLYFNKSITPVNYMQQMTQAVNIFKPSFASGLTLYSMIALLTRLEYYVFENIMENQAFCSIFHNIFKSIQKNT